MSNLQTVKIAFAAEIKNAREGVAFYTKRIVELEKLQKQLGQLDIAEASAPSAKKNRNTTSSKLKAMVAEAAPTVADGKGKIKTTLKLPATKTAFWQGLLSDTPMANQEILAAAIAELKIRPTPVDLQKLKQRLANFITTATKDGAIHSDGTGRARRFFAKKPD